MVITNKTGDSMVKFFTRVTFRDGGLVSRMLEENLPAELKIKDNKHRRIQYECSEELALALLRAGAPLEFIIWSNAVLEYKLTN